ncbi:cupredoxin superfamily protein [Actinidia rufa]|uniref:Cupredoxin superfamily protein n=1 Tax=Actinidia rufa TaxID=165716 RepID=A0A7J0FZZ9_9ERIC|nr:cupredoxin superfamily protein [Actinidia rufa]
MLLRDHPLCVFISFLILTASLNVVDVRGATYLVGDSDGWTPFTNSTNWTQGKAFHVGDMLEFNYDKGLHNVMQVNSTAYQDCIKEANMEIFDSGNDSLVLSQAGQMWFICGVENHCENGQKLSINVLPREG